jgi:hypothetical protein
MRKLLLSIVAVCGLYLLAGGKSPELNIELPQLHQIKEASLSPSYSCRSPEEFRKGYEHTALYLADVPNRRGPDLLFNGACGSEDYFEAATAGDDMSLIADLGESTSLEDISASRAFNVERVHSFPAYSKFARAVKVEANHTYAVLLNEMYKRGLFVFTVEEYVPNKKVRLRYVVKSYQLTTSSGQTVSVGFSWDQTNAR